VSPFFFKRGNKGDSFLTKSDKFLLLFSIPLWSPFAKGDRACCGPPWVLLLVILRSFTLGGVPLFFQKSLSRTIVREQGGFLSDKISYISFVIFQSPCGPPSPRGTGPVVSPLGAFIGYFTPFYVRLFSSAFQSPCGPP
jgi:hypothetical protein